MVDLFDPNDEAEGLLLTKESAWKRKETSETKLIVGVTPDYCRAHELYRQRNKRQKERDIGRSVAETYELTKKKTTSRAMACTPPPQRRRQ